MSEITNGAVDGDLRFILADLGTRELIAQSDGGDKHGISRYDHNSERITFELPRYADGKDLWLCNLVQVHYINTDAKTRLQSKGIYEVDDLAISPTDESKITLSWLISRGATKYKGNLSFAVKFLNRTQSGKIDYEWNTAIYSKLKVGAGISNGEAIAEEYSDVLNAWKLQLEANVITDFKQVEASTLSGGKNAYEVSYGSGKKQVLEIYNGQSGEKGEKGEPGADGAKGERGAKGETGSSGIYYGTEAPTDPDHPIWVNPNGSAWNYILSDADKQEISGIVADEIINPLMAIIDESGVLE